MSRFLTIIVAPLLLLIVIIWLKGFFAFIDAIPSHQSTINSKVDAIIILTGGSERIGYAINLLRENEAEHLFISGVGSDATLETIINHNDEITIALDDPLLEKISLGYEAEDTKGNAKESARWIKENNYQSILLVTANYHLPRSLLEFKNTLPELKIVNAPIISSNVKLTNWWNYPSSAKLLVYEYNKFIAAYVRSII